MHDQSKPWNDRLSKAWQIIERHPSDYYLYLVVASAARREHRGDYKSLSWLNRALYLFPTSHIAHESAARSLLNLGAYGQALTEFKLALNTAPAYTTPSVIQKILKTLNPKLKAPSDLLKLRGDNPRANLYLALELIKQDQCQAAIDILSAPIHQSDGIAIANQASCLEKLGKVQAAAEAARYAAKILPSYPVSYQVLIKIRGEQEGRLPIDVVQSAVRLSSKPWFFIALSASSFIDNKQFLEFERLITLASHRGDDQQSRAKRDSWLGYLYRQQGKTHKALEMYLRATQADPQELSYWLEVAQIYTEQGNWKKAQSLLLTSPKAIQAKRPVVALLEKIASQLQLYTE